MATPVWITPAGFIGTLTEQVTSSISVEVSGATSVTLISGVLPDGVRIDSTGTVYGTPHSVGITTRSEFVLRATNSEGVKDRTFFVDISGPTAPVWITAPGFLRTGVSGQYYSINGEFVDYQLSATYDALPPGQKLRYYIAEFEGQLPPGLYLTRDGRITGQVKDNLTLNYTAKNTSGYDLESYDEFPYDHIFTIPSGTPRQVKFLAKTYQFKATVTDGVASSKQTFKITVENPESLRVDDTLIAADTGQYTADASYLLSPQWRTPANLGYMRANNTHIIALDSYDFEVGIGPVTYRYQATTAWDVFTEYTSGTPVLWNGKTYICIANHSSELTFDSSYWELNELPPYFNLDQTSGTLYASIPYQPAFSTTYTFTIFVTKTETSTQETTYSSRKFTITVKGDVESSIQWITGNNLGTLIPGRQSELSIAAKHLGIDYTIQYRLVGGRLPTGLTLNIDGTISGYVEYNSQTYIREISGDGSLLILDGGTTTFDKIYNFTIQAGDIYGQTSIEQDFYLSVNETTLTKYTTMYAEPLMSLDRRRQYTTFVNDSYVFDHSLIYRLQDPAFGIQQKIQLYIEHGIEQAKLDLYSDSLRQYFYNKKLYFGEVTWSRADDADGNYVYDVVYVNIIDNLQLTSEVGLSGSKTVGNVTVYPNSTINMRNSLTTMTIEGITVKTDEFLMPRFMRTIQPASGNPLGYVLVAPLCYALPGKGDTIVKRIDAIGFDFKELDFEIDRLILRDNLTYSGAKYLLFPRKEVMGESHGNVIRPDQPGGGRPGVNPGEDFSIIYGPEPAPEQPVPLYTEDGNPLQVEI